MDNELELNISQVYPAFSGYVIFIWNHRTYRLNGPQTIIRTVVTLNDSFRSEVIMTSAKELMTYLVLICVFFSITEKIIWWFRLSNRMFWGILHHCEIEPFSTRVLSKPQGRRALIVKQPSLLCSATLHHYYKLDNWLSCAATIKFSELFQGKTTRISLQLSWFFNHSQSLSSAAVSLTAGSQTGWRYLE